MKTKKKIYRWRYFFSTVTQESPIWGRTYLENKCHTSDSDWGLLTFVFYFYFLWKHINLSNLTRWMLNINKIKMKMLDETNLNIKLWLLYDRKWIKHYSLIRRQDTYRNIKIYHIWWNRNRTKTNKHKRYNIEITHQNYLLHQMF